MSAGMRALNDGRAQEAVGLFLSAGADTARAAQRVWLASSYAALNDVIRARQAFLACLDLEPNNVSLRFQYARFLHQNLFLPEAVAEYRRVVDADSTHSTAWFQMAQAAKPLGEPDSLLQTYYTRVVQLNPRDYLARFYLGSMWLDDSTRVFDGVQELRSCLALNPVFVPVLERLATHHFRMREDIEAAAYYRKASDLRPANAELRFYLGEVFRRQKLLDSALVHLRAASQLDPAKATYIGQLGYAFFQLKEYDSAAATYRRAIALEPDNPQFHLNLALTYERMERIDDAAEAYRAAVRAHAPDAVADVYVQLGHLYFRAHRYRDAQRAYQRSMDVDPSGTQSLFFIALAYDQANDGPAALRHYRAYQSVAGADTTQHDRMRIVISRIRALERPPAHR
jgi:tetratricopeptide (TPR) repeat protein